MAMQEAPAYEPRRPAMQKALMQAGGSRAVPCPRLLAVGSGPLGVAPWR